MIPKNEQGVVSIFSKFADELGYQFVKIGTACPDAIVEANGKQIRVEFEYRASNFKRHKHNPDDVDLIVCWEDDYPDSPLPVLSLAFYSVLRKLLPEQRTSEAVVKRFWQSFLDWFSIESRFDRKVRKKKMKHTQFCEACGSPTVINDTTTEEPGIDYIYSVYVDRLCENCGTIYHEEIYMSTEQ